MRGDGQSDPKMDGGVSLLPSRPLPRAPLVPALWPDWTSLAGVAVG